jgi:methylglyoxal synthase
LIAETVELPVRAYKSGPLGGDQQIGSRIAEGGIDLLIFFWDPLEAQPHDPDIKALLRIAVLYDIPVATNRATADFILSSPLMRMEYTRNILDYKKLMSKRTKENLLGE